MPRILVTSGPESGLQFELSEGRQRLGASGESDITVAGLAPMHAEIHGRQGEFFLIQTAGGELCLINGKPAEQKSLRDGDRIRLGTVELLYRADAPASDGLVAACNLFYLFRAMHGLWPEDQRLIEAQIRELASSQLPGSRIDVLVGGTLAEWEKSLKMRYPDATAMWAQLVEQAFSEGHSRWAGGLLHAFCYGPGQSACLVCHTEDPSALEQGFAALAALASAALETASELRSLTVRAEVAEQRLSDRTGLRGESGPMQQLKRQIEKVAPRETTVLIQGESGTGKELVARAIHGLSPRAKRAFVALNCAAIADTLLESELFGHEKGAFTGATEARPGKLELAAGGTVFLDEIGEMALPLQAKLLRVLQQRECERVGGRRVIPLDIRVVAATNRDLASEVRQGRFREDLFHRLNVISLNTPPLRERQIDILPLAEHFLVQASERVGRRVSGISASAAECLRRYHWPGNVRELENVIERAVVLGDLPEVQLEDLPEAILEGIPKGEVGLPSFHQGLVDAKKEAILEAWREAQGDYKQAAKRLGIHPNSLLRMIRNLGLREELKS